MARGTLIGIAAIVALAGLLRFAALGSIPPGIYPDEAIKGVEGLTAATTGDFKLFYPSNNGREGLWVNLIGLSVSAFGVNQFSLRFWAALFGTLTVAGVFLLTRRMFASDRVALLAAFFMAAGFWHLNFSRIAFRAIMVPLLMAWSVWMLLEAWRPEHTARKRLWAAFLGGLIFGVGLHTYIAFRIAPAVIIVFGIVELVRRLAAHETVRPFFAAAAVWVVGAALTAAPMAAYFAAHPADFSGRSGGVSVLALENPAPVLARTLTQSLGMFSFRGDCNGRHNDPCMPQLIWPVGLAFLIGVWIAARRAIATPGSLWVKLANPSTALFAWLCIMLAPAFLTWEGIPHALRAIGTTVPAYVLAALGADWVLTRLQGRRMAMLLVWAVVIGAGAWDAWRYFGPWAHAPETRSAFAASYVDVARALNALPAETPRVVVVNAGGVLVPHQNPDGTLRNIPMPAQTVMYLTMRHPAPTYLVPEDLSASALAPGTVIAFLEPDDALATTLRNRYPDAIRTREGAVETFTLPATQPIP